MSQARRISDGSKQSAGIYGEESAAGVAGGAPRDGAVLLGGLQPVEEAFGWDAGVYRHRGGGAVFRMDRLDGEAAGGRETGAKAHAPTEREPLDGTEPPKVQRFGSTRVDDGVGTKGIKSTLTLKIHANV